MRIGSLFSGVGGLEFGLHIALGGEIVWQVEREAWPRRVLAARYPEADRSVTDVCEACTSDSTHLAPVDLVCGGFPCQDISAAGRGAGITGEKSGLWSECARILRVLRPRIVVVENSNLLPLRGLDVVLGDLAALGYDAEWTRIGARDVGAPHRRWRCFIVAWLPAAPVGHSDGERRAPRRVRRDGEDLADTDRLGRKGLKRPRNPAGPTVGGGPRGPRGSEGRDALPASALRRVADGLPGWLGDGPVPRAIAGPDLWADGRAALRALGNAVVPQVAYSVGLWVRSILEREGLALSTL